MINMGLILDLHQNIFFSLLPQCDNITVTNKRGINASFSISSSMKRGGFDPKASLFFLRYAVPWWQQQELAKAGPRKVETAQLPAL